MKGIDNIKLEFLKGKLKDKKIKKPTRHDIIEILKVSYPQAGLYLRGLSEVDNG